MTLSISPGQPREAEHLLRASHALMEELFPSESNHYLSLDELEAPNIRFLVAREGDRVMGCGAIALKDGYAEVKSMFTDEAARGRGVADAVLTALTETTRSEGLTTMRLETGHALKAAHRLYQRHGFSERGPFGDYPNDPLSLFFEKEL